MALKLQRFFIRLVAFSALLSVIIYALQSYTVLIPKGTWGVFGFFFVVSLLIFMLSTFTLKASPAAALKLLLGTLMLRLFLSFGYFAIYVSFTGDYSFRFAIIFMILYLFFTVFENYHLVINLRPDSKNEPIGDV